MKTAVSSSANPSPFDVLMPSDRIQSLALGGLFVATAIVNGLVTAGVGVTLTNKEIADSHPTYLLPSGYTFSVWGVIYTLVGIFTVLQLLPGQLKDKYYRAARPWAAASLVTNIAWLYFFADQLYWMAAVVIVGYAVALLTALERFDVDYLDASKSWKQKLGSAAFSANSAWVCVATGLQICGNLLEEGWSPSADFCVGLLFLLTGFACYNIVRRTDFVYALVSGWALGGIINNQGAGSDFGTKSAICNEKCKEGILNICNGGVFSDVCNSPTEQVLLKSTKVVHFAYAAIGVLCVALVLGVLRGVLQRRAARHHAKNESFDGAQEVRLA